MSQRDRGHHPSGFPHIASVCYFVTHTQPIPADHTSRLLQDHTHVIHVTQAFFGYLVRQLSWVSWSSTYPSQVHRWVPFMLRPTIGSYYVLSYVGLLGFVLPEPYIINRITILRPTND